MTAIMKRWGQRAVLGLLTAGAGAAAWGAEILDASDPARLSAVIQDLGYRARLDVDNVGDPLIHSSVSGTDFAIIFYGCDEQTHDACDFLLFKVGYDLASGSSLDAVNQWNATQLIGRAYLDEVDDPWLEMPLVLARGVSRGNFEAMFEWWETSVSAFELHIGSDAGQEFEGGYQHTGGFTAMASPPGH